MKLFYKSLNLEAGRPIAFMSSGLARRLGIIEGSRIEAIHDGRKLVLVVNTVKNLLSEKEISFSEEAALFLKLRNGSSVNISLSLEPLTTNLIMKKLQNKELTRDEIFKIIQDIVDNSLNEAEIAYFVAGVYHNGMSPHETIYLTEAIAKTGKILKWGNKIVADKHSIGGIPGNRTTPIVVAICAAAGLIIPKTSSRAITSAAGTADVMETITNVSLSTEKLKNVVEKTNACLAWGGSLGLAPADDKLIRVEKLLNIDPEAQLISSIIAKKIAVGSKYVLIDIPFGKGAKVSLKEARILSGKFIKIGKHFGMKINVSLTDGSEPLGNGVGPLLEMEDVLNVLNRKSAPKKLEEKSLMLAGELLEMTEKSRKGAGKKMARSILNSGQALIKFNEIVTAQGRKKFSQERAHFNFHVRAEKNMRIISIDNKTINSLARILGCPTSKNSGIYLYKHKNERISRGEKLISFYSDHPKKLKECLHFYKVKNPFTLVA